MYWNKKFEKINLVTNTIRSRLQAHNYTDTSKSAWVNKKR